MKTAADLPPSFKSVLEERGVEMESPLQPLKDGGNNQVFRIGGDAGNFALKRYFQHPGDNRDRFSTEKIFYTLLWSNGVRQIPEPFAWDAAHRLGLFAHVEGRKLASHEITGEFVKEALQFVAQINALRRLPGAEKVPAASEGFFSIPEQISAVGKRVATLKHIEVQSATDQRAHDFANNELAPVWQAAADSISSRVEAAPALGQPLKIAHRCLSPSDFGFHNALLCDGRLLFLDFEYAGWDDPAKLVCDFFCQPQVPVSFEFWDEFNQSIAASLGIGDLLIERASLLLPLFQIKWCCIVLNHFIKVGRARREFAGNAASEAAASAQLEKAAALLKAIGKLPH